MRSSSIFGVAVLYMYRGYGSCGQLHLTVSNTPVIPVPVQEPRMPPPSPCPASLPHPQHPPLVLYISVCWLLWFYILLHPVRPGRSLSHVHRSYPSDTYGNASSTSLRHHRFCAQVDGERRYSTCVCGKGLPTMQRFRPDSRKCCKHRSHGQW